MVKKVDNAFKKLQQIGDSTYSIKLLNLRIFI